jgi:NAD(P)-dependent dehydrogenase (short-subunit alcohol dehydrogenase family)
VRRFDGRVVLVTGGGGGIGSATAARLAEEGARVVILDLDGEAARNAAESTDGLALEGDVTREETWADALARIEAGLGPLDVLVNNAARTGAADLAGTEPEGWDAELATTLRACYLGARAVLPGMAARGRGAIVNVGSVNGLIALGNPAYSAAKAGLLSLTRTLAAEYGPKGIRANMVSPGTVHTGAESWRRRLEKDPAIFDKLRRWYPVGRVGRPDDIAAAIAYLAADEAGFVNGANLVVDGGLTAGLLPMIRELAIE